MRLGVVFPQTEIGNDPHEIRSFAEAIEQMGYDFIACYDHVVGAHPVRSTKWGDRQSTAGPYTHEHPFHEPLVLFGYLAAVTNRIELFTNVLILPQRQTTLVAKQAVEVAILSGGRLRLGVGVGWNEVEYAALGIDFHRRGARLDEQLELLLALWSGEVIEHETTDELVDRASLNPVPDRAIPLWFGGRSEQSLRRTARFGAGWMPNLVDPALMLERRAELDRIAIGLGREPTTIGQSGAAFAVRDADRAVEAKQWTERLHALQQSGCTHVSLSTMGAGYTSLDEHIRAARRFWHHAGEVVPERAVQVGSGTFAPSA